MDDDVHPVADAEDRGDVQNATLRRGHIVAVDRRRAAAQDDPARLPLPHEVERDRRWMDLRVDTRFANAARDELRELRAVIEDQDPMVHLCGTTRSGAAHATGVTRTESGEVSASTRRDLA